MRLPAFRFLISFVLFPFVIAGHRPGNPYGEEAKTKFEMAGVAQRQHGPPDQVRR
jgi:hypothetical protein